MKALKKIMVWMLISLTIQVAVLYYVDNYLFSAEGSSKIVSKKVVNEKKTERKMVDISLPEDAEHVNVSYDGGYISYYKDGVLKVIDVYTGKEKEIAMEDGYEISCYEWVPDRDIVLIAMQKEQKGSNKYLFCSYDAERDKKDIMQTKEGERTSITASKNSYIEDIQLTPLTNTIYIKTALKGGKTTIYCIDVMKQIEKVRTEAYFIGDIGILPNDDRIAYEDSKEEKVYITGTSDAISIKDVEKLRLLSVDQEDKIYLGEIVKNEDGSEVIKSIYSGRAEQDTSEWKKIDLKTPSEKENIFVSKSGKIYINDNLRGCITEIETNKETVYKGSFMQIFEDGIASSIGGKLVETPIK